MGVGSLLVSCGGRVGHDRDVDVDAVAGGTTLVAETGGSDAIGVGGQPTGGRTASGGAHTTQARTQTGGAHSGGGLPTGGTPATGGFQPTGGFVASGGTPSTGGSAGSGGRATTATGGVTNTGGTPSVGGTIGSGGTPTGGSANTGGTSGIPWTNVVSLTPGTGTLRQNDVTLWSNKGYQFTVRQSFRIVGAAWYLQMPASGFARASIYDAKGTRLAMGSIATGDETKRWYDSYFDFTFAAGATYTLNFYTNRGKSSPLVWMDSPQQPFDIPPYMQAVYSVSSSDFETDDAPEEYPSYIGNTWAPFIQFYLP